MRNFLCPLPTLIGKATKSSPGPCHQSPGKAIQNNKQQQKLQEISSLEYLQPTLNKNPEIKSQRRRQESQSHEYIKKKNLPKWSIQMLT
jgi:hypothetical protein